MLIEYFYYILELFLELLSPSLMVSLTHCMIPGFYSHYFCDTITCIFGCFYDLQIFIFNCIVWQGSVKVVPKDLIQVRHQIAELFALKWQFQNASLRILVRFQFHICSWMIRKAQCVMINFWMNFSLMELAIRWNNRIGQSFKLHGFFIVYVKNRI